MATPLTAWKCDQCQEDITDPGIALVTYRRDDQRRAYDFRLVHKNIDGRRCDPDNDDGFIDSIELSQLLGADGLTDLLSLLSAGPYSDDRGVVRVLDFDGYTDLVRRVQIPFYEEARRYWRTQYTRELLGGANHTYPYLPDTLEQIANQDPEE
ncbi:hypothetical protein A5687_03340 [Mycobacterium mantenii]|uniref:hypothetical protein n=1 Tax=Mycobacterium mantenii TaxID=560555 RepID=UPI0007FDB61F|nr:hypothetical protein [Mycobacterium mantenii]OBH55021.1 hypothetical protein A5687_03340 [Mycobacterium mantenii]